MFVPRLHPAAQTHCTPSLCSLSLPTVDPASPNWQCRCGNQQHRHGPETCPKDGVSGPTANPRERKLR